MRLRVGLIGLGDAWQARLRPALRALADRFEVRAICDQVRHRAEQAAAEFQAEAVDGYHAWSARRHRRRDGAFGPMVRIAADPGGLRSRKAIYCASAWTWTPRRRERSNAASRSRESPSWPSFLGGTPRPPCG